MTGGMRTHLTLTADGRGVVTAARQSRRALGGLERGTRKAGSAAVRANAQTQAYSQGMAGARRAALMLSTALGGLAVGLSGNAIKDAGLIMDGIESSMLGAAGSATLAGNETAYLRGESERLGIVFNQNVNSYAKMLAAGKAAEMNGRDIRDVFSAIAETGVVFDLSAEGMTGALRAIEQMMSKGKVTAEELKLQLGDRLPGVMPIAAKAIGVTTAEFLKMLETGEIISNEFLPKFAAQLREDFGEGLAAKLGSARAEFNRMKNDLFDLQVEVARGGFMDGLIEGSNTLREALGDQGFKDDVTDLFNVIGQGVGNAADLMVVLAKNADLVAAGFAGIVGIKLASFLTAAAGQMALKSATGRVEIATNARLVQSDVAVALAAQRTAAANLFAAKMAQARAQGTVAITIANVRAVQAETAYAAAVTRTTAAQRAAAIAGGRMAGVTRGLSSAMALMGGPLGVAALGVIGLVLAYKKYEEATAAILEDGAEELELMDRLKASREGLIDVTRDSAKALLAEAEAGVAAAQSQKTLIQLTANWVEARYASKIKRFRDVKDGTHGQAARPFAGAIANPRVNITGREAKILDLTNDPRLQAIEGGFTIPVKQLTQALDASKAGVAEWGDEVKNAQDTVAQIRKRIENWETADNKRTATELSNAQKSLDALRAKLDLETKAAGMTDTAAATERLAIELVNKSKKAGVELSIEAARIEAGGHIKARARADAKKQWTALQTDLEERLKAATESSEETQLRTEVSELFNAAHAAGVEITREEIEARLTNIKTIEDETAKLAEEDKEREDGIKTYDDWLEAREKDLDLAQLTNKERDIELLAQDKINLARKAGIEIDEEAALVWARNHIERIRQMEREREGINTLSDYWKRTSRSVERAWSGMWDSLWEGNIDSAKDFGKQLLNILKRVAAQAAALMILRPILDKTGLGGLLGGGGGGGGGFLGNLLGGIVGRGRGGGGGGGILGGISGAIGGGLSSLGGALTGVVGAIPGIGGALAGGLGALGGALGGLAAALGPIGLMAGAVFALTKLFKKTPRLKSYFGSSGGRLVVTGSETRGGASDELTQGLATQVNSMLEKLGATLTGPANFTVLYKPDKNFLDVNFEGKAPRTFGKDDIEQAITYTVSELLKSNAVTGIDPGLQDAIRRAGDITDASQLDALINQYTSAQDIGRLISDELARRENPAQFELDQLEAAQAARRAEIESYQALGYITDDVVEQLTRLEGLELDELLERLGDSAIGAGSALDQAAAAARTRISVWLADLGVANDNSPLSVVDRRGNALTAYQDALLLAQGGDVDALNNITGLADQLLALDREATSSAAQRAILYNQIVTELTGLSQTPPSDPLIDAVTDVGDIIADVLVPAVTGVGTGVGVDLDALRDGLIIADRGGVDDLLLELGLGRGVLNSLRSDNLLGFGGLSTSFADFPTTVQTSNDNVVQALNDNITALQAEITLLRSDTQAVGTAVTTVGNAQVAVLDNINTSTTDQTQLLEQQATVEGWELVAP